MIERFYQQVCENASDLILCARPAGNLVYVNRAWQAVLGYSQEEAQTLNLTDIVAPQSQAQWRASFQHVLAGARHSTIEAIFLTKQGLRITVEADMTCQIADGAPVMLQAISRDITERKQVETLLRESEDSSRTAIAAMEAGVVLQHADGTIRSYNASAQRILGVTADQLMGCTSIEPRWRAIHEDGTPFPGESHPAMVVLRTGLPCSDVVMGIYKPDDTLAWVSISSQPLFHHNDTMPYAAVTSFVDITARKHSDDALREREAQYQALFEHSLDAILLTAPDGNIIAANPEACRIFQATEADLCQGGRWLVVDLTDPRLLPALEERARTGQFRGELRFRRRDGAIFPGEVSSAIFTDRHGQLRSSMLIRDVSERQRMEGALRGLEQQRRVILDTIPDLVWLKEIDGRYSVVNAAFARFYGRAPDAFVGKRADAYLAPVIADRYALDDIEVLNTGRTKQFEIELEDADAQSHWFEVIKSPIYDDQGRLRGTTGIARDITQRKQNEQALRESEERFARVFRASPVGISITTLDEGRLLHINDSCLHILGYARAEIIGRTVGEIGIWRQPAERAQVVTMLQERVFHHNWGMQFVTKAGQVRDGLISMERIELKGQACLLTLVYDITEWKQLEYERERLIGELQEALANIKTLRGLIPICAGCKNIRDDQGYWNDLESYLHAHTDADFSHGICPACMQRMYPDLID